MKLSDLESIHNHSELKSGLEINRRHFLSKAGLGLGGLALASLSNPFEVLGGMNNIVQPDGITGIPHFGYRDDRWSEIFSFGRLAI